MSTVQSMRSAICIGFYLIAAELVRQETNHLAEIDEHRSTSAAEIDHLNKTADELRASRYYNLSVNMQGNEDIFCIHVESVSFCLSVHKLVLQIFDRSQSNLVYTLTMSILDIQPQD